MPQSRVMPSVGSRCHELRINDREQTWRVIYRVDPLLGTAAEFSAKLKERGLLISAFGGQYMRAVTHLEISPADIDRAAEILKDTVRDAGAKPAKAGAGPVYA